MSPWPRAAARSVSPSTLERAVSLPIASSTGTTTSPNEPLR